MLDVLITSSSRPQLFPYMWESFKRMCIIRQPYRVIVHEDVVVQKESKRVLRWLEKLLKRGEIHDLHVQPNGVGLGYALDTCLKHKRTHKILNSEYCFYLQEDWEFERPIDIDQITWTMDRNPKINLIFFNKIKNNGLINRVRQEQRTFSGLDCAVYHGWTFLPGIWRTDFVRKHWKMSNFKPEANFIQQFGTHDQRMSVPYCENKIGAYIYGKTGEFRYVRHLGNNWRMAKWQMKGKGREIHPGGRHGEHMDKPYMAHWVPYPQRPIYGKPYNEQELKKMLEE